jgi:broad specificity phosphatase PhoE
MKGSHLPLLVVAASLGFAAATANAQQMLILVRHAELQAAAMAAPKQVPLSQAGTARAARLAELLKDAGIDAIYATDFRRTQKTAEPLSRGLKETITIVPKSDPNELLARLRKEHAGHKVLLVGHTDTLPGLLSALGYPGNVKIEPDDYGNIFVLVPKGEGLPVVTRLHY